MTGTHNNQIPALPDTHIQDMTGLPLDDQIAFGSMFAEAMATGTDAERTKQRGELGYFAGDLIMGDRVQRQADLDIETAKNYSALTRAALAERQSHPTIALEPNRIGWLSEREALPVHMALHDESGEQYYLGSITAEHRVTNNAYQKLEAQGAKDSLMDTLRQDAIPRFLHDLRSGRGRLRPVNMTANNDSPYKYVNTSYPAYKLDVQGSNNRAIIMLADKIDDRQAVIVAALYDHEDQAKVINVLS